MSTDQLSEIDVIYERARRKASVRRASPYVIKTCPECDGDGEWDEYINRGTSLKPSYPEYRHFICDECGGIGTIMEEAES